MPAAAGTKRMKVKGVSVYRPFVFGSIAEPFTDNLRPLGVNAEHTHQWRVYVRGVDGEDISYWLKRVQFKLHETYPDALRTIEAPPFEVTETGWGEFDVQIKLHFVPEANEKAAALWHGLKLHPYGPDAEGQKERKENIVSQHYEEILFNEPSEALYEILTSGPPSPQSAVAGRGKGSKGSKQIPLSAGSQGTTRRGVVAGSGGGGGGGERTAEIPHSDTPGNPYSQKTEGAELDRLHEATKTVDAMVKEERARMEERDRLLKELQRGTVKGK
ncbi:NuA4 histone H4 acetyltransferase complex and the SWR1 complex subunit [Lobaria immixta]|nr:NuA4 histone H4 acetyltransferase complex and the SWR1 complex subunit [Lobaria immixta]